MAWTSMANSPPLSGMEISFRISRTIELTSGVRSTAESFAAAAASIRSKSWEWTFSLMSISAGGSVAARRGPDLAG